MQRDKLDGVSDDLVGCIELLVGYSSMYCCGIVDLLDEVMSSKVSGFICRRREKMWVEALEESGKYLCEDGQE